MNNIGLKKEIIPSKVIEDILASSMGLKKYVWIVNRLRVVDISHDLEYQTQFNGFYKLRRDDAWRRVYYAFFEEVKNSSPSFEQILKYLFDYSGAVEASYASKMLATINTEMPIWDQYIIKNLGVKLPSINDPKRMEKTISIYNDIVKWYQEYLTTENAYMCLQKFNVVLPHYKEISPVKKIDFFLWSIREG